MARGQPDGDLADEMLDGATGPFDLVTMKTGPATLSDLALKCAARLATKRSHYAEIEELGLAALRNASEPAQWRISHALALLPSSRSGLDLRHCAVHPTPALRALAALRWGQNSACLTLEAAIRLARDEDHRVRQVLARAMHDNRNTAPDDDCHELVASILAADPRRSVRRYLSAQD